MSRVGVAGGTGLVGRHVVDRLRGRGHEAVVLSRAGGVDLVAGDGLAACSMAPPRSSTSRTPQWPARMRRARSSAP